MNYAKIIKIVPMLDSPVDAEALSALRALSRALAPENFGDVARLIEAAIAAPEPVREKRPFSGFAPAGRGPKPERPKGDGWVWSETRWEWVAMARPTISRFETANWVEQRRVWEIIIDYTAVTAAAMEVMNHKLTKATKAQCETLFLVAMGQGPISTYQLLNLEQIERNLNATANRSTLHAAAI